MVAATFGYLCERTRQLILKIVTHVEYDATPSKDEDGVVQVADSLIGSSSAEIETQLCLTPSQLFFPLYHVSKSRNQDTVGRVLRCGGKDTTAVKFKGR